MLRAARKGDSSGGSRIFPRGGANSQKCYYFSIFCRKLHENERIWTPGGARVPGAPPWIRQWILFKTITYEIIFNVHLIHDLINEPVYKI